MYSHTATMKRERVASSSFLSGARGGDIAGAARDGIIGSHSRRRSPAFRVLRHVLVARVSSIASPPASHPSRARPSPQPPHRLFDLLHRRSSILPEQPLLSSAPHVHASARHRHRDRVRVHPVPDHPRVRSHRKNRRLRRLELLRATVYVNARSRRQSSRAARPPRIRVRRRPPRRPRPARPVARPRPSVARAPQL